MKTSEDLFICEKLRDTTNFVADPRLTQEEERNKRARIDSFGGMILK